MSISVFDLFSIGIGPSSSHTVGPMRAARRFLTTLEELGKMDQIDRVSVELFGSLAHTGLAHGTDAALLLGLEGEEPETVDPDRVPSRLDRIRSSGLIRLLGKDEIEFSEERDLIFNRRKTLPYHSNGMVFSALDAAGDRLEERTYYSVGGGFTVEGATAAEDHLSQDTKPLPHHFRSGSELLAFCDRTGLRISELMLENEEAWRTKAEIRSRLDQIRQAMKECVERGCTRQEEFLPGTLKVRRRAPGIHAALAKRTEAEDPLGPMDWINLYALAVNEENASGGRVVTAPTNGAAGILPAVLLYYERFCGGDRDGVHQLLLAAGAIGILYKENASISGAEVGCQGEVGVACSMAAAGLTEALGGAPAQVEEAAEIGMEHNLGLTCDPVGGYVQIPCIERNAMGAVKAINASRMALAGDGTHHVSLDDVIKTMRQTGADMKTKYKESSRGGLAVNVIEC